MASGNNYNIHIGKKIMRLCEIKGIKQIELAHALNISQQAVSKLLHHENIDPQKLSIIAAVLKEKIEDIRSFNEEKPMNISERVNSTQHDELENHIVLELYKKNMQLSEQTIRLLNAQLQQSEKEKNELLQQIERGNRKTGTE